MAEVVLYADSRGDEPVYDYIEKLGRSRAADAASIERYIDLLESKGERLQYPFASLIDKKERQSAPTISGLEATPSRVASARGKRGIRA